MKQKIAITLVGKASPVENRELVSFIDRQAQGNRSDDLNLPITQERQKSLTDEIIIALREDVQDPVYQSEIAEWDRLVGDGIDY